MDLITKTLADFGLSINEIKIYLAAIKYEETNPFSLAKATGIPRTTVYEVITSLSLKGLVEMTKSDGLSKQQTRIKAKNPSELRQIIRNRRSSLTKLDSDVVHILPMMKKEFQQHEANADFQFFPGIEGAKHVFSSSRTDDVDLPEYLFHYKIPDDAFGHDFVTGLIDRSYTIKRRYTPKEILPLSDWTKHCLTEHYARNPNYINVTETRYIDNPVFDLKIRLAIKSDRIWIVSVEKEECYGIMIKSQTLASSLVGIFQVMWLSAVPVTDELVQKWM
jgi:sugar-specific transcriptional regulator TrmB